MDDFDQAAADLEKAIAAGEADDKDLLKSEEVKAMLKDPAKVREALQAGLVAMAKAKGAQPTDLSQEKAVKDKNVTDDEDEGDEGPKAVPSGRGYKDTRPYVGKHATAKGDDHDDDDDDDGDDKPSFFGKKGKGKKGKKGKKAYKGDEESDADGEDATEFMENMGKAVDHLCSELHELRKSHAAVLDELEEIKEGSVIFGQVLADPRRDNAQTITLKALQNLVGRLDRMEKAFDDRTGETANLLKSIANMPGAPRVAGLALAKSDGAVEPGVMATRGGRSDLVSEGDKGRLMKARVTKQITDGEWRKAMETGDVTILEKVSK